MGVDSSWQQVVGASCLKYMSDSLLIVIFHHRNVSYGQYLL